MLKYNSNDEILQDLLETNIRQRGNIGGSAKKAGLRIKELERIYGIREGSHNAKGSNMIGDTNNFNHQNSNIPKTEKELAERMGVAQQTLQNYKQLANMIPELSELVDTGIVTKTTALSMMRNLSEPEQEKKLKKTKNLINVN